ncbi:hypothetical protein [Halospina denitrificans]|uniref:hypothetical protein n=1 Tax=Halospina denitrificans TaxID=332522 RepID=UPI00105B3DE1|nr:hypothetical protein [Halospina denitrificans]
MDKSTSTVISASTLACLAFSPGPADSQIVPSTLQDNSEYQALPAEFLSSVVEDVYERPADSLSLSEGVLKLDSNLSSQVGYSAYEVKQGVDPLKRLAKGLGQKLENNKTDFDPEVRAIIADNLWELYD